MITAAATCAKPLLSAGPFRFNTNSLILLVNFCFLLRLVRRNR